jgi:hypothetical protein
VEPDSQPIELKEAPMLGPKTLRFSSGARALESQPPRTTAGRCFARSICADDDAARAGEVARIAGARLPPVSPGDFAGYVAPRLPSLTRSKKFVKQ